MNFNTKFTKNHDSVVLGLFDTGLGIIRSLGREGIPVVGFDFAPEMSGFKSRYCRAKLCPNPVHQPEELLRFLIGEGKKLSQPGICFPASDTFVIFLSRFRNALQPYFHFILPPEDVVEAIVNKKKQYELAEKAEIPYPKTFYPFNLDDIHKIKKNIDYPVFIKPVYSYKWQEKFPGIKGFKVNNAKELERRCNEVHSTGIEVMVQEIIPGPNTNHSKVNVYINNKGKVLALFTLRKIRQYPVEFGVGSCVESIYNDELRELGLKFFQGINYCGIGSIEFKKDERDGKFKLIELNPRYWQQNSLSTVCGMNFPLIQYLDLTGQNPKPQTQFSEGVKWLDAIADFQSFWDYYRRGKLSLWRWLRSFKSIKSFATFALDDFGPFLKKIEYGLKIFKLPFYLLRHIIIK